MKNEIRHPAFSWIKQQQFFLLSDIDRNKVRHENSDGEFDFELTLADGLTVLALQGSSFQVGSL
jgi:hypothetical protein